MYSKSRASFSTPFYGGYGLIAEDDLPKPAFNAFRLLHRLGNQRIDVDSGFGAGDTHHRRGLAIAVWNLRLPEEAGEPKDLSSGFQGPQGATSRVGFSRGRHARLGPSHL